VLYRKRQVLLRREPPRVPRAKSAKPAKPVVTAELSAPAVGVFERLRAWRAAAAKEQSVPAYVIFHDATLREIASRAPSTLAELSAISGVGEAKLAKYGQQVLEVLAPPAAPPAEDSAESPADAPGSLGAVLDPPAATPGPPAATPGS
jgi:ATP-dependent DNA helicase RecQ